MSVRTKFQLFMVGRNTKMIRQASAKADLTFTNVDMTNETGPDTFVYRAYDNKQDKIQSKMRTSDQKIANFANAFFIYFLPSLPPPLSLLSPTFSL